MRFTLLALCLVASSALFLGCQETPEKGGNAKSDGNASQQELSLLNVSYDASRELWRDLNAAYQGILKTEGKSLAIETTHAGSSAQSRKVLEGLEADVVTLGQWTDTDAIRKEGLIKEGWEDRFPNGSLPYFSTIVFVVRKGNPKNIQDWKDLIQPGVEVITPNPKTSGNGALSLMAAWGSVTTRGGSPADALGFVTKLYGQVKVLDTGGRGATMTFSQKKIGDVHLTWENEGHYEVDEAKGDLELIYPPVSIRAEPRVAVVDTVVDHKGTRQAATDYLNFLYTPQAQKIIAEHYFRPSNPEIAQEYAENFHKVSLFTVKDIATNWEDAQQKFIATGGVFDQTQAKRGE